MIEPLKLTIELVPKTCWYSNVRSEVSQSEWDFIRKKAYRNANFKCEICGGVGTEHPVECHEIWHYDDKDKIQTLVGFQALCPACHTTKHAGLANVKGKLMDVVRQLKTVNEMSQFEAEMYVEQSFRIYAERSRHKWTLNINFLKDFVKL